MGRDVVRDAIYTNFEKSRKSFYYLIYLINLRRKILRKIDIRLDKQKDYEFLFCKFFIDQQLFHFEDIIILNIFYSFSSN